ncbi:MAG: thioesterase family protein [Nocardioidaceae bacterium]
MGSEFDADTAVESPAPQRYSGVVSDRWNTAAGPNGGYLLALCMQALRQEMPFPDPVVISAFFLRPVRVGDVVLDAHAVRAGRRTATGEARMEQDGRETVRVLSTFADLDRADGRTLVLDEMPDLPAPETCLDAVADAAVTLPAPILERVEYRFASLPGWAHGRPGNEPRMEFWMRLKDGRDPDLASVALMVDAAPPAVLDIGARHSTTMELSIHLRARPAPGWLACRVGTRYVMRGMHEEDFEVWDSAGTLVAQSRQLALLSDDGGTP